MKRWSKADPAISMMRSSTTSVRICVAVLATLLLTIPAHSQTQWIGLPAFSTQLVSETDSINPANLNVHLTIPIFKKQGRGLNYFSVFSYDNLGYVEIQTNPNYPIYGWVPASSFGFWANGPYGLISWTQSTGSCGPNGGTSITNSNYVYRDENDTSHSFSATIPIQTCNGYQFPGLTASTNDGSGYKLVLDASANASIMAIDGTTSGTGGGGYPGGSFSFYWKTDSNGNQLNSTTDTLGTVAMKGNTTYPQPGNPSNYIGATITSTSYSLHTNFGCTGINEYAQPFNTTTSLITKITLADGSYYAFTYEPTPGFSGYVTGRIASVRYPSGGTVSFTYNGAHDGSFCDGTTASLTRVTPDGSWSYSRGSSLTTIIDPKGNQTLIDFDPIFNVNGAGFEVRRRIYQGSTTLLRTVETCYNGATFPCVNGSSINLPITRKTVRTELPDSSGIVSEVDTLFNSSGSLVTESDEYDFGSAGAGLTCSPVSARI